MKERSISYMLADLLNLNGQRRKWLAALVVAGLMTAFVVSMSLMRRAVAVTHTEQVLDCQAVPGVAHTHNADCYDAEGNLVCPLPEVERHVHSDSCYSVQRSLVCGKEEVPAHHHSESCYDDDGNLVCGKEETDGHKHTDACYEVTRTLTCGKDEVIEEHVHGPGCFRTIVVNDEPSDGSDTTQSGQDVSAMPKQSFVQDIKDDDDNVLLTVEVVAPEGALPQGSSMRVDGPQQLSDRQLSAVKEAIASKDDRNVIDSLAVGLTFLDADGNEVKPVRKVAIVLTTTLIEPHSRLMVAHVDDLTEAQVAAMAKGASEPIRTAQVVEELVDEELSDYDLTLADNQLAIADKEPGTYVLTKLAAAKTLNAEGADVIVTVDASAEADIPDDAQLVVNEVTHANEAYDSYLDQVTGVVEEDNIRLARFFDIAIVDGDGVEVQPERPVDVTIELKDAPQGLIAAPTVVSFDEQMHVVDAEEAAGASSFEAEGSSVWGVVYTITKTVVSAGGKTYQVTVSYDDAAQIPEDATLEANEIPYATDAYAAYLEKIQGVLSDDEQVSFARFFDIKIVRNGQEVQPQGSVEVKIELANELTESVKAVHFKQEGTDEAPFLLEASLASGSELGDAVSFETDGFSVYGVAETQPLPTASDVSELDGKSYYLSVDNNNARFYFRNTVNNGYVLKTNAADIGNASLYTFEKVPGEDNQFYLSTILADGNKAYATMNDSNTNVALSETPLSSFTVEPHPTVAGAFFIYYKRSNNNNKKYALYYTNSGFNGNGNAARAQNAIVLTEPLGTDPYGLDGKSYGIINNQNTVSGTAMMTNSANNGVRLGGRTMPVRVEPRTRNENVFVAEDSEITMWSFSAISGGAYYITAEVDGTLKYLRLDNDGVTLVDHDNIDQYCKIMIEPGTGTYSGKYKFSSNGRVLMHDNGTFRSYGDLTTGPGNGNYWMNLAELSDLKDDDFVVYTAEKVSVSGVVNPDGTIDYDVKDGDQVVIYTRIWDDTTKRYEYYAIDYDGMLVKAYESGDTISWVGSKVNTMLWDFTEYKNPDGTLNYYYELQNAYSGKYLAPQVSETDFLSDSTIGINLNGRRNGEYYSTILAWDDPYYEYASLKVKDWQLTSAPLAKADTFYFAVMKPEESSDEFTQVATIDHKPFGITLKMQDYEDIDTSINRSREQLNVLGNTPYVQTTGTKNLLLRNITDDYPSVTGSDKTLAPLYNQAMEVNNQFLLSTYQETGYFEYDCTQNFAHLITSADDTWYGKPSPSGGTYDVGDFVVYNQLGTTTDGGPTRQHGQFFPYNDLKSNHFVSWTNQTDVHAQPLSSLDPRKGEKLYAIDYKKGQTAPNYVDHFFGMEMTASFMQSENGLDAWGHDLIFEFSGDDDFWLYVDDMLVLDLGGIHQALDGSINFRTGTVIENGTTTNLRTLYKLAYCEKYSEASDEEVEAWLDGIFKENEEGVKTVFKDYSGHTMRMFYMERGVGASNLHMRFNLAPYTKGEVLLEKEVSGAENVDANTRYPFQVMIQDPEYPTEHFKLIDDRNSVTDAQTGEQVEYRPTYTVDGFTYYNVFLLKPGQTVSIRLPEEETVYKIVECGMDTRIYDEVRINKEVCEGTATTVEGRKDYETSASTVVGRKKVIYDNHVSDGVQHTLKVTKKLWEDFEKEHELTAENDDTKFRFRIYIGKDANGEFTVYNTGKYYVKDPDGNYCIYRNGFTSTGKTDFSALSNQVEPGDWESEQEMATFHTSPGGMADKIPVGYSIEIPGLMEGTPYFVEERADEIPAGYNLIDYERVDMPEGETPNVGTLTKDEHVIVNNQHGYGLIANKVWSDADFMEDHDEIYFAVYLREGDNQLSLVPNSVRQLGKRATTQRWFLPVLEPGKTLNDYQVFEVTLTDDKYAVNDDGTVTLGSDCEVTPIQEGGTLTVGGTTNEHGYSRRFEYTASYEREVLTQQQIDNRVNSRTDTITNARPGIKIVKADMGSNGLAGATFTLENEGDANSKKTFTSGEDGLVAVAYLAVGEAYTLTETSAPYGYLSLISSVTIMVDAEGTLLVNGSTQDDLEGTYSLTQEPEPTATKMPTVTIHNRPFTLEAVKIDAVSGAPVSGVTFELRREVKDHSGNPMPDYVVMEGFETLVTNEHGVIPNIDLDNLAAGSYYLREKLTPTTYQALDFDIRLTLSPTGQVSIQKAVYSTGSKRWELIDFNQDVAEVSTDANSNVTLKIKNTPTKGVQIIKKSIDDNGQVLPSVSFELYKIGQISNGRPREDEPPLLTGTTGDDGTLALGALDSGTTYYLFETETLDGYMLLDHPVVITTLSDGSLSASLGTKPLDCTTIQDEDGVDIWQISVFNNPGVELPASGGPGTWSYTVAGSVLVAVGIAFFARRRMA